MLKFPKGFFDEEEREGFVVSAEMKHVWAAQFEMIKIYEEVCRKYGLKYFAAYGTLLGAVRHQGFIPWDDDVDIMMLRDDYNRFLEVCQTDMPGDFSVLNAFTEPEWDELVSRVVNGRGLDVSGRRLLAFHGSPYAIGVDIFAMDYVPSDKKTKQWVDSLLDMIYKLIPISWLNDEEKEKVCSNKDVLTTLQNGLKVLEDTFDFQFYLDGNLRNQMYCMADAVASGYGNPNKDKILTRFPGYVKFDANYRFLSFWFDETVTMKFESSTIEAPKGYDAVLYNSIGEDYMVPRNQKASHDYPFFKGQRKVLEDEGFADAVDKMRELTKTLSIDSNLEPDIDDGKMDIPTAWEKDSKDSNGEKKRVVLYGLNSAALLNYEKKVLDRLDNEISLYETNHTDTLLILVEDTVYEESLHIILPSQEKRYHLLKEKLLKLGGIISDSLDYKYYEFCDEYRGDCTSAVYKFVDYNKKVHFEKYE